MLRPLYPLWNIPMYTWYKRLGCHQRRSGRNRQEKNPCPFWKLILPYSNPLFTHLFGLRRQQEHDVPCRVSFVWCTDPYSQQPRGLKRRYAGARLLRLWVRIPPGSSISLSECCVFSSRSLRDELISRPEESYRLWCVVVCDLETSWLRRHAVAPKTNKQTLTLLLQFCYCIRNSEGLAVRMCGAGKTFRTARVAVYTGINWCPETVEQKMRGTSSFHMKKHSMLWASGTNTSSYALPSYTSHCASVDRHRSR